MSPDVLIAIRRAGLLGLSLLAALSITVLSASPAKAGTTITPTFGVCPVMIAQSGDYTLAGDVGPCPLGMDGILITASNVTLHLNGHTISSTICNTSDGIHVMGPLPTLPISMVRVLGPGTITNFGNSGTAAGLFGGFLAENSGGSFVKFTTITNGTACSTTFTVGFLLQSTTSMWKLDSNVAGTSFGIVLRGNDNDLVRNHVAGTGNGIELDSSSNNTIVNNNASNNGTGIILLGTSANNNIDANTTDNNIDQGIEIDPGATGNNLSGNKSFNNSLFDMEDDNANCDNNKWTGNHFNTPSQSCIH